jgi:hypothetical protein
MEGAVSNSVPQSDSPHPFDLGGVDALVRQGRTVISGENSAIIKLALKALEEGITATFYLKDALFTEVMRRWYATSERAKVADLHPISAEEAARIKADFDIEITDGFSSKVTCPRCESVYGTYEFIQQGIKEHGERAVRATFSLKDASVLQSHPRQRIICQRCNFDITIIVIIYSYLYRDWNHSYGCGGDIVVVGF